MCSVLNSEFSKYLWCSSGEKKGLINNFLPRDNLSLIFYICTEWVVLGFIGRFVNSAGALSSHQWSVTARLKIGPLRLLGMMWLPSSSVLRNLSSKQPVLWMTLPVDCEPSKQNKASPFGMSSFRAQTAAEEEKLCTQVCRRELRHSRKQGVWLFATGVKLWTVKWSL